MSKYRIEYLETALEDIQGIGTRESKTIRTKIEWLSLHCGKIPHQALEGKRFRKKFKLRVGDYRVIYSLNTNLKIILIEIIGHRSKIYKEK